MGDGVLSEGEGEKKKKTSGGLTRHACLKWGKHGLLFVVRTSEIFFHGGHVGGCVDMS